MYIHINMPMYSVRYCLVQCGWRPKKESDIGRLEGSHEQTGKIAGRKVSRYASHLVLIVRNRGLSLPVRCR